MFIDTRQRMSGCLLGWGFLGLCVGIFFFPRMVFSEEKVSPELKKAEAVLADSDNGTNAAFNKYCKQERGKRDILFFTCLYAKYKKDKDEKSFVDAAPKNLDEMRILYQIPGERLDEEYLAILMGITVKGNALALDKLFFLGKSIDCEGFAESETTELFRSHMKVVLDNLPVILKHEYFETLWYYYNKKEIKENIEKECGKKTDKHPNCEKIIAAMKTGDEYWIQEDIRSRYESSPYLVSSKEWFRAYLAFDEKIETAWCEGGKGDGKKAWIRIDYDYREKKDIQTIETISIINGYAKNEKTYRNNNRIKEMDIEIYDRTARDNMLYDKVTPYHAILNDDTLGYQDIKIGYNGPVTFIFLKIKDIYKGDKYNDACISEIKIK